MGSLQARLAVWLLGSILAVAGLHWFLTRGEHYAIGEVFLTDRLTARAQLLLSGLTLDADGEPHLSPESVSPLSRRPFSGVYHVVRVAETALRSASLSGGDLPTNGPAAPGSFRLDRVVGPQGQSLLVWSGRFERWGRPVEVLVAEDLTSIAEAVAQSNRRFNLAALGLLVVLIALQGLALRWTLLPIDRVRRDAVRLEAGEIDRLSEAVPSEIKPLVQEVNRLLGAVSARLRRSRQALANLAHSVKTPLTLLSEAARDGTFPADPQRVAQVRQAVARIQAAVDRELKLARLAGGGEPGQVFRPDGEVPALIGVLRQVHGEKGLDFEVEMPAGAVYRAEREDMLELFGNLLDNAAKWARTTVRLELSPGPDLTLTVDDDGPGAPPAELARLGERGRRLDEGVPGQGLGLDVVRGILEQYGGTLELSISPTLGGLRARARLPAVRVSPALLSMD